MFFFSALCFFGASMFATKSGNQIWFAFLSIGTLYVILGTHILKMGSKIDQYLFPSHRQEY